MKKLFTLYLMWVTSLLLNTNVLFAQYSYSIFNSTRYFYSGQLNSLNLSSVKNSYNNTAISSNFNVYPNPNKGKFFIKLKEPKSKIQVDIYNVWGQKIYEPSTLLPLPTNEINFSSQPEGVYFIKINDGENSQTEKIVIQ